MSVECELCIHNYDLEDGWTIEVYGDKMAEYALSRAKFEKVDRDISGTFWRGSTEQMGYFMRIMSGESVRVPKAIKKFSAGSRRSFVRNEEVDSITKAEDVSSGQKASRRTRRNGSEAQQ